MEKYFLKNKFYKYLRIICIVIGALGIINSILTFYYTSINLGAALPGLIGIVLFTYGVFFNIINCWSEKGIGKIIINFLKIGFLVWLISFFAVTAVLIKNAAHSPIKNADAIIVLGAGLNGDKVSLTLAYRLDAAIEYYYENSQPLIIVSGGQGSNELIPEAVAMQNYLIKKGVNPSDIIIEDQSHNTRQNFEYSKIILDNHFLGEDYTIVYATNQFHTLRAGLLAKKAGFKSDGLAAPTVSYLAPNQYLREYFSLIKYALYDSRH